MQNTSTYIDASGDHYTDILEDELLIKRSIVKSDGSIESWERMGNKWAVRGGLYALSFVDYMPPEPSQPITLV